ncbi:hypothetical protein GA0116948_11387 [Chitinophaga costaii]|uniref:Carboxypeptidase regulatory-like domain-containing protein n=1 Tax=Chitinophaga costaii TaxID=1335309 RepID=A0A1C4FDJ0_9BACT|nr:hypothetical protein [Chitinophaga costaii]PUZ20667.1 hypothetical protein DCM91_18040 [Chitinophaga costaii]SCC53904.1 hypothetical protein GA0116948_11387 [Chitinophaga costaii]
MSYQLIGNLSALICDDGIAPLANATLRIYLPELSINNEVDWLGIVRDPIPLSAEAVAQKADRLLAEVVLDAAGNFRVAWQEIHLFTEPLELNICITNIAGLGNPMASPQHFSLGMFVPDWKRHKEIYMAAFAYIVPSECWAQIHHQLHVWAITGIVRHYRNHLPVSRVIVQAFQEGSGKKLGEAFVNEQGRFRLQFAYKPPRRRLPPEGNPTMQKGPHVFFKVLTMEGATIWSENRAMDLQPECQGLATCTKQEIYVKPLTVLKSTQLFSGWRQLLQRVRLRRKYVEHYSLV